VPPKVEQRAGSVSTRVSYRDESGVRRQKRITAPDAESLRVEVARWVAAHADGAVEPSMQPLGRYLRGWHRTLRRASSTRMIYERAITAIEAHDLGSKPLGKLRRHHVQSWVDELATVYAPATVRQQHACLRAALTAAVRLELIQRNPALSIELPPQVESTWAVLSDEHIHALLYENGDDPYMAAWVLAVTLGLRKGELLALRWPDIDLVRAELRVNGTMRRGEIGDWYIADMPKTTKSRRTLRLPLIAQLALKRHQGAQNDRRAAFGNGWIDTPFVFDAGHGEPHPHPTIIQHAWVETKARLGIPKEVRLHDCRHTCATNLIRNGLPLPTVARVMGHANTNMVATTYAHVTAAMMDDAERLMNQMYGDTDDADADEPPVPTRVRR
jgi:integrase